MTFLDTGFLFALTSKRDAHHKRVVEVFRTFKDLRLSEHLLTTNHVIAETITLARRIGHAEAVRLGEKFYGWIEDAMVRLIEDVDETYRRLDGRRGG